MTGFEPRTSGVGSDRSTNWATTTAHCCIDECYYGSLDCQQVGGGAMRSCKQQIVIGNNAVALMSEKEEREI